MDIEQIIGEHGTYIYNFALKLSANPKDAEDLAQETFIKAWKHLEDLKNPNAMKKWLRIICLNEFRMKLKRENRLKVDYKENLEELEKDGAYLVTPTPSVIDEIIVSEEVAKLRDGCFLAMTRKLTINQRLAFSLVDLFGLSMEEAAELLGVTPKAVKGLLYRARMSLEAFFQKHCSILDVENPCQCTAWMEFMSSRQKLQERLKNTLAVLDYRNSNYIYDPKTREKRLYYYSNMPQQRPDEQWFLGGIASIETIFKESQKNS